MQIKQKLSATLIGVQKSSDWPSTQVFGNRASGQQFGELLQRTFANSNCQLLYPPEVCSYQNILFCETTSQRMLTLAISSPIILFVPNDLVTLRLLPVAHRWLSSPCDLM